MLAVGVDNWIIDGDRERTTSITAVASIGFGPVGIVCKYLLSSSL